MKTLLVSLLLLCSFAASAQTAAEETTGERKLYIGVTASAIGFDLDYKHEPKGGNINPYGSVNVGYSAWKRTMLQAGVWYSTNKTDHSDIYVESADVLVYNNDITRTRGVGVPHTLDYTLLYPFKRVQFYGTLMLTPMFTTTEQVKSQQREGVTTMQYSEKTSGMNTYLTAGFGLRFPLGKRFEAYGNYHLISRNFNRNLRPRDEYPYPGSILVGFNYQLKKN